MIDKQFVSAAVRIHYAAANLTALGNLMAFFPRRLWRVFQGEQNPQLFLVIGARAVSTEYIAR
jgi:hypothetical protein